jgi:hypothetical protein
MPAAAPLGAAPHESSGNFFSFSSPRVTNPLLLSLGDFPLSAKRSELTSAPETNGRRARPSTLAWNVWRSELATSNSRTPLNPWPNLTVALKTPVEDSALSTVITVRRPRVTVACEPNPWAGSTGLVTWSVRPRPEDFAGSATVVTMDAPLPLTVHVMTFDFAARASVDGTAPSATSRTPAHAVRIDEIVLGVMTKLSSLGPCSLQLVS